jgi:energy-coupling factor transporter ATP-binding protein EcfA2
VFGEPLLVVEDLGFRYRGRKRPALEGVSFQAAAGETVLVLGPSGGGKSTLALCLNGLIPHSFPGELSGQVRVAGRPVAETPVAELARTVGMVFQDPDAQSCMLRVDDEVAFGLENLQVPAAEMPARIARALALVGLTGHERTRIDRLSGGTRQRLALASVLAMDPPVLVLDEPTSNLDPAGAEEVFAGLRRLKARSRRTIVLIEHRLDRCMDLVDRLLILGPGGQPLASGSPAQVFRERAAELAALGIWVPQVTEVAQRLVAAGIALATTPTTVDEAVAAFRPLVEAPGRPEGRLLSGPLAAEVSVEGWQRSDPASRGGPELDRPPLHPPGGGGRPEGMTEETGAAQPWLRSAASLSGPLRPAATGSPSLPDEVSPSRSRLAPAVQIEHLSFTYSTGQPGLRDVSLQIPDGAFFAIVGPNGAGKSTLARHLIGSLRPPPGAVRVRGADVRSTPPAALARLVGYVFQNPEHQFVARTVFDELAFGLRLAQRPEDEVAARVEALLADFGLATLARVNPFTLSHGEKRRLSVATMLIQGQDVLVLDEPTFGQDRQNTAALMARLVALNQDGRTIVMITHDLQLVAEYAAQAAVLIEGQVAYAGPVPALFAQPALLTAAHLTISPALAVSRRLAAVDPSFPPAATAPQLVAAIEARAVRAIEATGAAARPAPEGVRC